MKINSKLRCGYRANSQTLLEEGVTVLGRELRPGEEGTRCLPDPLTPGELQFLQELERHRFVEILEPYAAATVPAPPENPDPPIPMTKQPGPPPAAPVEVSAAAPRDDAPAPAPTPFVPRRARPAATRG